MKQASKTKKTVAELNNLTPAACQVVSAGGGGGVAAPDSVVHAAG